MLTAIEIFKHDELTPTELKALIDLEEAIPIECISEDEKEKSTSRSNIFITAAKLIPNCLAMMQWYKDADKW